MPIQREMMRKIMVHPLYAILCRSFEKKKKKKKTQFYMYHMKTSLKYTVKWKKEGGRSSFFVLKETRMPLLCTFECLAPSDHALDVCTWCFLQNISAW